MKPTTRTVTQLNEEHDGALISKAEFALLMGSTTRQVDRLEQMYPERMPPRVVFGPSIKRWRLGHVRQFLQTGLGDNLKPAPMTLEAHAKRAVTPAHQPA